MRAANPHPAIPIRTTDVLMMPGFRLATPAQDPRRLKQIAVVYASRKDPSQKPFHHSSITALSQESIWHVKTLVHFL